MSNKKHNMSLAYLEDKRSVGAIVVSSYLVSQFETAEGYTGPGEALKNTSPAALHKFCLAHMSCFQPNSSEQKPLQN